MKPSIDKNQTIIKYPEEQLQKEGRGKETEEGVNKSVRLLPLTHYWVMAQEYAKNKYSPGNTPYRHYTSDLKEKSLGEDAVICKGWQLAHSPKGLGSISPQ